MVLGIAFMWKPIYKGWNFFFSPLGSLPFDDACAEMYARIRQDLSTHGCLIGPNDLLIAAVALANDAVLVTHNQKEFCRVAGLRLTDWE